MSDQPGIKTLNYLSCRLSDDWRTAEI